jgi:hypothetical protein
LGAGSPALTGGQATGIVQVTNPGPNATLNFVYIPISNAAGKIQEFAYGYGPVNSLIVYYIDTLN